MTALDNSALVERFIRLPDAQRKAFYDKLAARGMSLAQLPIPALRATCPRLPLSYAQQRQWFIWQMEPEGSTYNLPVTLRLRGALDVQALQRSVEALLARHETLRTCFAEDEQGACQIIQSPAPVRLEVEDVLPTGDQMALIKAFVEREGLRPFDLRQGPLLRLKLLRLAADDHVLALTLHHIVSDGWSMQVMVDELVQLYAACSKGREVALAPLPIQYADYALWQRAWMEAGEQTRQLGYWLEQLQGDQALLELPTDHPRPGLRSSRGARLEVALPAALSEALAALARRCGVTPFMLLLASFEVLLYRYSGQGDIRVGVPVANRNRAETKGLIGFFVNTQVHRCQLDPREAFSALLQRVKHTALQAQAHQDLPFEQLVEALQPQRSLSHTPLFQVMFNHQSQARGEQSTLHLAQLRVESVDWEVQSAQFDLTLDTFGGSHGLSASLTYATDLFDATTVARMAQHWRNLLAAIIAEPTAAIADLPMLAVEERTQLLEGWNATARAYPLQQSVQALIEQQVERAPQATALLFGGQQLSYAELNAQANRLAHRLIEIGVGPDVLVGIAAERSLEMVVGLLAVLKAGGAYVPLDPEYPQDRLSYMIEDSGIHLLLTQQHLHEQLPVPASVEVLLLEQDLSSYPAHNPDVAVAEENLAYVIYTSGSTGKPKGAGNRHSALTNRLCWMQEAYALDASDIVLQKTPFSFDVSVWEFFWPLMTGARLAIAGPGEHRDPARLLQLIEQHQVSTLHFVPSMLQVFLLDERVHEARSLKRIICSGEALQVDAQQQVFAKLPQARLYNLYGPTEAAIDVTHWTCREEGSDTVPIGQPIANLATYILDAELGPVPAGVIGELYLGGEGLARGYHRRPGLTAERFMVSPFGDGERLYRTGDLARYRPDGVIEYAGRIDHQVKIRGLRIELGEIEARLFEQAEVREAVVLAMDLLGSQQLVGYVVPNTEGIDAEQLKARLKAHLPDYMVPSQWVFLESLPLSPNGKLERKALPRPDVGQTQQTYVAPQTELEQQIAAIWQEVLQVERVGLRDDFFSLGGHSLLATQVIVRLRERLNLEIALKSLFTARDLGAFCEAAQALKSDGLSIEDELAKSLEALKRLSGGELEELIS